MAFGFGPGLLPDLGQQLRGMAGPAPAMAPGLNYAQQAQSGTGFASPAPVGVPAQGGQPGGQSQGQDMMSRIRRLVGGGQGAPAQGGGYDPNSLMTADFAGPGIGATPGFAPDMAAGGGSMFSTIAALFGG